MPAATVALAPIPLARAPMRLLVGPIVLMAAGIAATVGGVVMGGAAGVAVVAAGVVVVALAIYLGVVLLTMRLDVEVAMLRLSWPGGERRYILARGAVTRVMLQGEGAAALRPRFGAMGWGLGPAKLRRSEPIELVRLARSDSVILVPTDRGRLAIAPASERQLITALSAAARVQQRLDEVAVRARAAAAALPPAATDRHADGAAVAAAAPAPAPHVLTGIERAILEERLAAERAAALAAAEAERQASLLAAESVAAEAAQGAEAEAVAVPAIPVMPSGRRVRRRATWRRPTWLHTPTGTLDAQRVAPFAAASAPIVGALAVWGVAAILGRLDVPDAELRPISLALVVTGPLAALSALAARAWFPRLLGLVVVSAVAALILVGRALLA
jgi:hypothetical protein